MNFAKFLRTPFLQNTKYLYSKYIWLELGIFGMQKLAAENRPCGDIANSSNLNKSNTSTVTEILSHRTI